VLSPLASSKPDGLEWVAEKLGFLQLAQDPFFNIIPDYVMPGVHNEAAATILAGVIGCAIVIALAWLIVKRRQAAASKS